MKEGEFFGRKEMTMNQSPEVFPHDVFNQTLFSNGHPADWKNPELASWYHLVVIGTGTAGLVTAAGAAGLGAKGGTRRKTDNHLRERR